MLNINPHKGKHFGILNNFLRLEKGPESERFKNCCYKQIIFPVLLLTQDTAISLSLPFPSGHKNILTKVTGDFLL